MIVAKVSVIRCPWQRCYSESTWNRSQYRTCRVHRPGGEKKLKAFQGLAGGPSGWDSAGWGSCVRDGVRKVCWAHEADVVG